MAIEVDIRASEQLEIGSREILPQHPAWSFMNITDWKSAAAVMEVQHQTRDLDAATLREILVGMHRLFIALPITHYDAYRDIDEEELSYQANLQAEQLARSDFAWRPQDGSVESLVMALAVQIRATDQLLYDEWVEDFGPPLGDCRNWLCQTTQCYVVPRDYYRYEERTRREGQVYSKRGLLRHRLIPASVGGLPVQLIWQNDDRPPDGVKTDRYGAALFRDIRLEIRKSGKRGFIATGVAFPDLDGCIEEQVRLALEDECVAIVWPELTVDPAVKSRISDVLGKRFLFDDRDTSIQFVLAGSWHEKVDGKIRNRASILDGGGRTIHQFDKLFPAPDHTKRVEHIERGSHIPIFLNASRVIAMAICRDFCSNSGQLPLYPLLDVDLVLVTSMGGADTMKAHIQAASAVQQMSGARSFVVQQDPASTPSPSVLEPSQVKLEVAGELGSAQPTIMPAIGFVLSMPERPSTVTIDHISTTLLWSSYFDQ